MVGTRNTRETIVCYETPKYKAQIVQYNIMRSELNKKDIDEYWCIVPKYYSIEFCVRIISTAYYLWITISEYVYIFTDIYMYSKHNRPVWLRPVLCRPNPSLHARSRH